MIWQPHIFRRASVVRPRTRSRRGFTLMETALATVIVGVGTLGMFALVSACIGQTRQAAEVTAGMNLARNIRELSLGLAYSEPNARASWGLESGESSATPSSWDDIDDLDGRTISPPITATRTPIANMPGWTQQITATNVVPERLTLAAPAGSTSAIRVTAVILRDGRQVCELSWFVFKAEEYSVQIPTEQ